MCVCYLLSRRPSPAGSSSCCSCGEAGPVDLAGRGSRQRLAELDDVRHHVARQPPPAVVQHVLAGEVAAAVRGDDRPQAVAEQLIRYRQHRRLTDGRVPVQRGFHLAQLYPVAADLHHGVPAAQVGVVPRRFQGHQVTGPVHQLAGLCPERVRGPAPRRSWPAVPSTRASARAPARTARPPRRAGTPGRLRW